VRQLLLQESDTHAVNAKLRVGIDSLLDWVERRPPPDAEHRSDFFSALGTHLQELEDVNEEDLSTSDRMLKLLNDIRLAEINAFNDVISRVRTSRIIEHVNYGLDSRLESHRKLQAGLSNIAGLPKESTVEGLLTHMIARQAVQEEQFARLLTAFAKERQVTTVGCSDPIWLIEGLLAARTLEEPPLEDPETVPADPVETYLRVRAGHGGAH
jgi:hypothetical protein